MPDTLKIALSSIDDVLRCVNLASLLEVSGYPKPGNIHRTIDFAETRFEHFLAGISAIQPNFRELCLRTKKCFQEEKIVYKKIRLGHFYTSAARSMMNWQQGGNVLLGHILILGPLIAATNLCLIEDEKQFKSLEIYLKNIIESSTPQDTVGLYKAMDISNPGGLGKVEKYDLNDKEAIEEIRKDKVNLKKIFDLSQSYDLIASEYANNFHVILHIGLPYFLQEFESTGDINKAVVNTFLKILGKYPDTLIIRKSGEKAAHLVSQQANLILEKGGISTEKGLKMAFDLDKKLQTKDGALNPGTTADIIAGIIYCGLISGIRF